MLSFTEYLTESQEINLSIKAFKTLSLDARDAIESWETVNWAGGELEKAIETNNKISKEIAQAFEPVREYLHKKYGDTIKLYRGVRTGQNDHFDPRRVLYSWTNEKKTAEIFAGYRNGYGRDLRRNEILSDNDIEKLYQKYQRDGFLKFRHHIYKKNDKHPELNNPDYYDIYTLSRSYVTDGDDLRDSLRSDRDWDIETNKKFEKSKIIEKNIPIDHIVWVTNNLNSKEFIVRNK